LDGISAPALFLADEMSGLCGLVDFSNHPVPTGLLESMAGAAHHRGSAEVGIRTFPTGGLCQLTSLPAAERVRDRAPRQSADGTICLVADARLDNRGELLTELAGDLPPETQDRADDADLLLAAYRRWGTACTERLLGDFAFAVWDIPARRLLLARDPLGIKALHYARIGPALCFASEARQILRHPGLPRKIDEMAVSGYLTGWLREPEHTFFEGIRRLPPGHQLLASSEPDRLVRFWHPGSTEEPMTQDEAAPRFLAVFQQAVADRLPSSGSPAGLLLSGGLDSSSIAAVAQRQPGPPLLTCTFAFERLQQCDERVYVRQLANELDLEVAFIDAESRFLLGDSAAYAPALETPFLGWESCNQRALEILRDRGGRVLLTGLGADDLLRGSARIVLDRFLRGDWRVVKELRGAEGNLARLLYLYLLAPLLPNTVSSTLRRLAGKSNPPLIPPWIAPGLARRTRLAERVHGALQGGSAGGRARREIRRFALDLAPYERVVYRWEILASAWGVEVRYPFLDRRLFDLVLSLSPTHLYDLRLYKPLLRRAVAGVLPEPLRTRRGKSRLGAFLDYSLRGQAASAVEELLRAPMAVELGWVEEVALQQAWQRYRKDSPDSSLRALWFVLTLELWLRRHFATEPMHRKAS
jgi:asparagine synthase (glutamine-hydrolysing)